MQAAPSGVAAYPMFNEGVHWTEAVEPHSGLPLRLAFDFNVNPMVCIVAQLVTGDGGPELHVIDTVALYGGSTVD